MNKPTLELMTLREISRILGMPAIEEWTMGNLQQLIAEIERMKPEAIEPTELW